MAVLKVIEVLASSPVSWEDATASAVKMAAKQSGKYVLYMYRTRALW